MLYKLISSEGDQTFELRAGVPLVVGRALNSDIPVFDPTISRRHAEVACDEEGVRVRDLGSSNGTYLNGTKIEAARVAPGDIVTFGKVAFRLKEATAEITAPAYFPSGPTPRIGATIIRQLPVGASRGGVAAAIRASGARDGGAEEATPTGVRTPVGARPPLGRSEADRIRHRLGLLLEVSTGLSRVVDIDALLEKIVGYCFDIFDVDRCAIELSDEGNTLVPKVARDRKGTAAGRIVPRSIASKAVEEKVAILSDNALEDQRFGGQSIVMQRVRSTACAPLVSTENRVLGVLYVDNTTTTHRFTSDDLDFLIAFASIAAIAIENSQFSERLRQQLLVRSNFERFFAPSLAERIASSPDAVRLGGEKREVAVLFSDIRGFTALSEEMNPDAMASLLTEYFTEMVECVFRNGGTLDKFIGDAVMAQWGAPIGTPGDADRAMSAALDMMAALRQLNAKWRAEGRPELQIGIGLNFGEAFAGNIGSERRLEYTVIGDTVNTASRLCSAAEGGDILLTDDMRRALTSPPRIEECPSMELKNKSQPVSVYRVVP
jgi:adenylate cyclase